MDAIKTKELLREARTILKLGTEGAGLRARDCIAVDIIIQWAQESISRLETIYEGR